MLALQIHPHPTLNAQLQKLNERLRLPLASECADATMLLGWVTDDETDEQPQTSAKLALFPQDSGPVLIDFLSGKKNHRRQFGGGKGQPLARAVGINAKDTPSIIDATAGMGGDAFVFATLGCEVQMVERSPVVAALLQDALTRGKTDLQTELNTALNQTSETDESVAELEDLAKILKRLSLVNADATDYLRMRLDNAQPVDVIYLDPMYPEKKKSASAKKEMKALQNLLGPDLDSSQLLQVALKVAQKRVVVKRPAKAPPIVLPNGQLPTSDIKSPNTRYDLYVIKALLPR